MRDRSGRVIYVGKASSLRARVRTYFRQGTLRSADPKLRGLIKSIADLDVIEARSEAEATLTEGRLIKDYRPRYNVSFRDDKRFLLLRVDPGEPFPRFTLCRIGKDDGGVYYGPYASAASARAVKEFVEKRFGLRVCRPHRPGPEDHRHCLADVIRFCAAPCACKIDERGYHERVEAASRFLRGEDRACLEALEQQMREAAAARDFERAAVLRDTLLRVRDAVRRRVRAGKGAAVRREEAAAGVEALGCALGLGRAPRVLECYDISNISGTHAVGSMVCAVDGQPARNRYRLFRIRTVEGTNDPGMMAEVIHRRFRRALDEEAVLPDLVLVDGGLTQLRAARGALDGLGLHRIPVAGLAKRYEEVYWEGNGPAPPLRFDPSSPALYVLQQIRDEAHRFALTYHRKLRRRRIRESRLDDVPGIGAKRKELLLQHFGSIRRLESAPADEIAVVPGIGLGMARRIAERLSSRS
jgi:excinuclease ABC subunit C